MTILIDTHIAIQCTEFRLVVKYLQNDFVEVVRQRIPQLLGIHAAESDEVPQSPRLDLMATEVAFQSQFLLEEIELGHVERVLVADGQRWKSQRVVHCHTDVDRHWRRHVVLHTILQLPKINRVLYDQFG